MKKTLQFAFFTLIFTMLSGLSTAQWTMMDGSTLFEDAALGWVKVHSRPQEFPMVRNQRITPSLMTRILRVTN
jgi:hypothetical protein